MDQALKRQLKITAAHVRLGIVDEVFHAKSGHPGGSLSIADVLTYLYFVEMKVDPSNPKWAERDRFVLSKGHTSPALYSVLAQKGFFPVETLKTFRKIDSFLQGHPDMKGTPGVDMSTGSLGLGISAAVGMALSAKISGDAYKVFSVLGDGELQEGQVWEAAMFASAKKLENIVIYVDNNNLQIDGTVEEVNSPYPIPEKFAAFGWHVIEICGHDFDEIEAAYKEARTQDKPVAIIGKSVKGKCVSFMENNVVWHGSAPNAEQHALATKELSELLASLEVE